MSIQPISHSAVAMQSMVGRDTQVARSAPAEQGGAVPAQGVDGAGRVPGAGELQKALEDVARAVAPMAQSLEFSLDKDSGRTVVKVMDTETNEVIRQIPSEEVLAISKAVDKLKGLLLKQQA
ncbi:flagellar protein FlaG [Thauera sinica]|uniref:Flagellar protein FlaG n=1 Tax=Thauera sinica TaxID=2665146 RepID=A0ABW1APJ5_9RHOO|nr:flagellar protein FlaG [Thauera sp. K11]ATE59437.1 flagellar biosynthesis protein FlaG [Thauera sp. K11]